VATQDGVFCLPPGATEVVRIAQQGGKPLRAEVNAIAEAPDRSVWIGTAKGLFRVPPGASELQPVETPAAAGSATRSSSACCSTGNRHCGWTLPSPVCIA
jgi:ligand-binding sensor domain-containing protein